MRIADILDSVTAAIRLDQHRRMVYRELSAMGDRELQDLGIARCDIAHIARTSYPRRAPVRPAAPHGIPSTGSAFPA